MMNHNARKRDGIFIYIIDIISEIDIGSGGWE
jgi:hypothetical protein